MFIVVWLICAFACATIAEKNGRSPGKWFLYGIIFGIFAVGAILLLGERR